MTHRALKQCSNGLECPCNHRISCRATGDADEELAVPVTNELGPPGTFWRTMKRFTFVAHLAILIGIRWLNMMKKLVCGWDGNSGSLLDYLISVQLGLLGLAGLASWHCWGSFPVNARRGCKRLRLQMTLHLHNRYHQSSPGRLKPSPSEPSRGKDQRAKSLQYRWPPQPRAILRPVSKAQRFCDIPAGWYFGNAVQYLLEFMLYIIYTVNTWISTWANNEFIYNQEINKT